MITQIPSKPIEKFKIALPAKEKIYTRPATPYSENLVGLTAPELKGDWLNCKPVKIADLINANKTVLLDFCSFSVNQTTRSLPHLLQLRSQYASKGLVVISVHCPEFSFEKDADNVRQSLSFFGVNWAAVNDTLGHICQDYNNDYTPRRVLISPQNGVIVYDQIGEDNWEGLESAIREQLTQTGAVELGKYVCKDHIHKLGNFCYPASSDIYLGSENGFLKNDNANMAWARYNFDSEPRLFTNKPNSDAGVALNGLWQVCKENICHARTTKSMTDYLSLVFSGTEANMIAGSNGAPTVLLATLNGVPIPSEKQGQDVVTHSGKTFIRIAEPRMYQIITGSKQNTGTELRLYTDSDRLVAYGFNFNGCGH